MKKGTWSSNNESLWYTWAAGGRSGPWTLNSYSGNFSSGSVMMKDLGTF